LGTLEAKGLQYDLDEVDAPDVFIDDVAANLRRSMAIRRSSPPLPCKPEQRHARPAQTGHWVCFVED